MVNDFPVWPFPANWSDDLVESYEWLTEILQSQSGAEQRRCLRIYPRRFLEFSISALATNRALFDNLMSAYGSGTWYLPFLPDKNQLSDSVMAGANILPLKAAPDANDYAEGHVIIIEGDTIYETEAAVVQSIGANSVTLTAALAYGHGRMRGVFPAMKARLVEQPTMSRITDNKSRVSVKFQVMERNKWPLNTTVSDSGPLIMDGLITNSYQNELGRGGYFHANSGTSEGQSIMIHALFQSYLILRDGSTDEGLVADWYKNLALDMLDALGDGSPTGPMLRQEIPSSPDTICQLHWLFAARGDIPIRDIVYDLDIVEGTDGNGRRILTIPTNARGSKVYTVWRIYPADSALLYDSPYSPAYHVNESGSMEGADTSIAIADDDSGFLVNALDTTVYIPDGAGAITPSDPDSSASPIASLRTKLQGEMYNTLVYLDGITDESKLAVGSIIRIDNETMKVFAVSFSGNTGIVDVTRAVNGVLTTHDANSLIYYGNGNSGGTGDLFNRKWKVCYAYNSDYIIPIKQAEEAYPSWTSIQSGYVACAPDTFRWFDQAIGFAIDIDDRPGKADGWTQLRHAMRRSCIKGQAISDLRMVIEPMVGFDAIPGKGEPDGMYCYSDHPSALPPLSGNLNANWLGYDFWTRNSHGVLVGSVPSDNKTDGTPPQVQIGRGFTDTWRKATTYQDPDYYLYISVGCSRKPDISNGEGLYVYVSSEMSYSETTRWYAEISNLSNFVATSDGSTIDFFIPRSSFRNRLWAKGSSASTWGESPFDEGITIENFGISVEMHGSYTVWLKNIRFVSGESREWIDANQALAIKGTKMPFFPGALPFAINADTVRQRFIGWNGSPFHGYQFVDFWWYLEDDTNYEHPALTVADLPIPNTSTGKMEFPISATNANGITKPNNALLMEQQLIFLQQAQNKYKSDAGDSIPIGPFAHTFVLNTPARSSLIQDGVVPTPHTWVYTNDDPNTEWIGYQCRIVEVLGSLVYLTKDDARFQDANALGKTLLVNWLNFLNSWWPDIGGREYGGVTYYGTPTNYPDPRMSVPYANYEEPHGPALILRGCLFLKKADVSYSTLCDALMLRLWTYIETLWVTADNEMQFTWSPDPASKMWYGFWHGEIMLMLCDLLNNPSYLPSGIDIAVVRQRLVQTQTWLEKWGVRKNGAIVLSTLPVSYDGYSVITDAPNESSDTDIVYSRISNTLDSTVGVPIFTDTGERNYGTFTLTWNPVGKAAHNKLLSIFHDMRGRCVPVWIPTFMQDFVLDSPFVANSATLVVKRCGFTETGGPRDGRQHVAIFLKDGTTYFRKITGSARLGSTQETIALDTIIRMAFSPQNVARISFMELCRLSSDTVEISHRTDTTYGASEVKVAFIAAPDKRNPDAAFYQ